MAYICKDKINGLIWKGQWRTEGRRQTINGLGSRLNGTWATDCIRRQKEEGVPENSLVWWSSPTVRIQGAWGHSRENTPTHTAGLRAQAWEGRYQVLFYEHALLLVLVRASCERSGLTLTLSPWLRDCCSCFVDMIPRFKEDNIMATDTPQMNARTGITASDPLAREVVAAARRFRV